MIGRVCDKPYQDNPDHDLKFPFYSKEKDGNKKIAGVILSIREGESYNRKYLDYEQ